MGNLHNGIKGGPASRGAALLCKNPVFLAWLGVMQNRPQPALSEEDAAQWLRKACKVTTRAMIDHDAYALNMFNKIRRAFSEDVRAVRPEKQNGYQPFRNREYLDWVKTLPCVVTEQPADDPHHLIGHGQGGMGTKAPDLFAIPMTRTEHTKLHDMGYQSWEEQHGSQWFYVAKTIERAVFEGVLEFRG